MKNAVIFASASLMPVFLLRVLAFAETPDSAANRLVVNHARQVSKLHRVTDKPFKMDAESSRLCRGPSFEKDPLNNPHHDHYCHVFVDESGLKTMKSGVGEYPAGAVIVKQKFANSKAEAKSTELYTLMRKMEPGYDSEHGDWEYSIVNRNATQVLARGRIESCIECHKPYQQTDYVTRLYMVPSSDKPTTPAVADPNSK